MCIAGVFLLLALLTGIAIGYRDGARTERLLWEVTAQSDRLVTVTLKNEPATLPVQSERIDRNLHSGMVRMVSAAKPMVNVPDPRTYEQFESTRP
jgi:hypothetical protein